MRFLGLARTAFYLIALIVLVVPLYFGANGHVVPLAAAAEWFPLAGLAYTFANIGWRAR